MKIRLVLLVYDEGELITDHMSKKAFPEHWNTRISILEQAMQDKSLDLVITSNDFFVLTPNCILSPTEYLEKEGLLKEFNQLPNKIHLITGVDLHNNRIIFNPYNALNSIVYYLPLKDNSGYKVEKFIWESWIEEGKCNQAAFASQNENRIIEFKFNDKKIKICLLSCGDILSVCHVKGKLLPLADIYLGVAHVDFKKWFVRSKEKNTDRTNIHKWKNDDSLTVIVTQNITRNKIENKDFFAIDNNKEIYQL